jgi:hypothetical protein
VPPSTVRHSNRTDIAVPSGSPTVALSVGVIVWMFGRPAPVTHGVAGTVARAEICGSEL